MIWFEWLVEDMSSKQHLLNVCMNDEPYLQGLDWGGCLIGCWVDTWQVESSCRALHLQFLLLTWNNQKLVVHIASFPIALHILLSLSKVHDLCHEKKNNNFFYAGKIYFRN